MATSVFEQWYPRTIELAAFRRCVDGGDWTARTYCDYMGRMHGVSRDFGVPFPKWMSKLKTPEEQLAAGPGDADAYSKYIAECDAQQGRMRDRVDTYEYDKMVREVHARGELLPHEKAAAKIERNRMAREKEEYDARCEERKAWKRKIQSKFRDYMSKGSYLDSTRQLRFRYDMVWINGMDPMDDCYPRDVEIIGDKMADEWRNWANRRCIVKGKVFMKNDPRQFDV